eukprot:scaffold7017_cov134-Cylindrotheca_fusiformis.AAC.1
MRRSLLCSVRHAVIWLVIAFLVFSSSRVSRSYLLEPAESSSSHEGERKARIHLNRSSHSSGGDPRNEGRLEGSENTTMPALEQQTVAPLHDPSKFHPTTSLASRQHCHPSPHQPMLRVDVFENYANSSDYWTDLKQYPESLPVVCEFNDMLTSATHFPHAMQQLYGCFSYWQEYPTNTPVLLLSDKVQRKLRKNPFLKGVLQVFQSQLQVEITSNGSFSAHNNVTIKPQRITVSGGYILNHANKLHEMVQTELNLPGDSSKSCREAKPRIGILNRRKSVGRSIINAEIISEIHSLKNLSRNEEILGYAIPNFFGSLAINSGTMYSYLYMSAHPASSEQADSLYERTKARSANLCPSPAMIVESVQELVQNWQSCCASMAHRRRI